MQPVHIGHGVVGPGQPSFIVAEIGINHNGDVALARTLVQAAAAAGCNAVKFQTFVTPCAASCLRPGSSCSACFLAGKWPTTGAAA